MYNEIIDALGIKRYGKKIDSFKKIDVAKKFDLITAYLICFNNHKKSDLWHIREWDFFLNDLFDNNLLQGGKIYLSFNLETVEEPMDKKLLAYFDAINAKREHLSFTLTYEDHLNSNKEP